MSYVYTRTVYVNLGPWVSGPTYTLPYCNNLYMHQTSQLQAHADMYCKVIAWMFLKFLLTQNDGAT